MSMTVPEKLDQIERVSRLYLRGFTVAEIARELDISRPQVNTLIRDYETIIKNKAENDPDFMDRLSENTLRAFDEMNMIASEAWTAHEKAKDFEMLNMQAQFLKLAMEVAERKAKLLNMLGMKADTSSVAKMRKLEKVNEIVSSVIREIVSNCEHCRIEAQIRLAEAFELMNRQEEAAEMNELKPADFEQEYEEEDNIDHEAMMGDVLSGD